MDERELLNAWRELFRGKETTPATLKNAEVLLGRISGESPIRVRLASELAELKMGKVGGTKKKSSA